MCPNNLRHKFNLHIYWYSFNFKIINLSYKNQTFLLMAQQLLSYYQQAMAGGFMAAAAPLDQNNKRQCKWFSITLLKPYCDTDQNTYRAHNRNKYHHVYSAHRQTELLQLAFDLFIQKEKGHAMSSETETPPPGGAGLSVLNTLPAFWLWSAVPETLHWLWYTARLHLNLKQSAPVQLCFKEVLGCFNLGPSLACFLWFLRLDCRCSRSFPCLRCLPGVSPVRWQARSALRPRPPWEAPPWAWAWSQWGCKQRTAPRNTHKEHKMKSYFDSKFDTKKYWHCTP